MTQVRLTYNQSLDYDVFDEAHNFVFITTLSFQDLQNGTQRSFVTTFSTFRRFIIGLLISIAVFIDGIVCQMHEEVVHISCCWFSVRLSAEPCHSLLVYVYSKWIHTVKKHINPEIILQVLNEMRVVDVMLDHKTAETFILLRSLN